MSANLWGWYTEDVDYSLGTAPTVNATAGKFRAGWARCACSGNATTASKTLPFPGGAQTSAWLHCCLSPANLPDSTTRRIIALGLGGNEKSLGIGIDGTTAGKLCIYKWDGVTRTQLAAESGTSITVATVYQLDLQVVSFGATATVNLYLNGSLMATYTGDVTLTGMTNFDSVFLPGTDLISEVCVADFDTRTLDGVFTGAASAGTADAWTGTPGNVVGTSFSDANPVYSNTNGQDEKFNITDGPAITSSIMGGKITARMAASAAPAVAHVKLGWDSSGVAFGTGASKAPATTYGSHEQYDALNPVTGLAFAQSELNALQINLQSAT